MTKTGKLFVAGALVAGLTLNILFQLVWSCDGHLVTNALTGGAASSCSEFWLNRYQTLIGVIGAGLVGWMVVLPVWRQVRLMSAQSALQLRPFIEKEWENLEQDASFLATWRDSAGKLGGLSARVDFWPQDREDFVDVLASELIAIRGMIGDLESPEWRRFAERLDLEEKVLRERVSLRRALETVHQRSIKLSTMQHAVPDGMTRKHFTRTIRTSFDFELSAFLESSLDNLYRELGKQEAILASQRERVRRSRLAIQDALQSIF